MTSTTSAARLAPRGVGRAAVRVPRWVTISLLLAPALTVVGLLFVGGLAFGVAQSFGYLPFLDGWTWSLDAYRALWGDPAVRASFALTFRLALISTALATALGVAAALLIHRSRRGRRLMTSIFSFPLPVPHLVGAVAMLLLLSQSGLLSRLGHAAGLTDTPAGFPSLTSDAFGWGIIIEYVWKETPFIGVVVLSALSGGLAELEEVARTLGARPWQRFRRVVLPLITPSVAATSLLVFAFTFGSYEVPFLLGRPFPAALPVVALQYYQDPDLTSRPQAMAVAVLIAVLVGLLVAVYLTLLNRFIRRIP